MTQYWFRPKRYGYGCTPVTWEGWAVTFAFPAALLISIAAMELWAGRPNFVAWMIWAACVAVATGCFVQFSRRKTDGEWRWRWGERSDGQPS